MATRTAVIVTAHPGMLERLVEGAGYEVVGEADTAFNGEQLVRHFQPDVIVVENELRGIQGWEALSDLRAASSGSQILLVVADDWTHGQGIGDVDAFAVVTRDHLEQVSGELEDLATWISQRAEDGVDLRDRRTGRDRRRHQDWSAVGFEKRRTERRMTPTG